MYFRKLEETLFNSTTDFIKGSPIIFIKIKQAPNPGSFSKGEERREEKEGKRKKKREIGEKESKPREIESKKKKITITILGTF